MTTYEIIARLHAIVGVVALAAFWTAGLARKGSPIHLRSGRVFLLAMVALLALAVPMCVQRIADGRPSGWFLTYLLLITATASWSAWRSIRLKRDFARYTGAAFRTVAALNIAAGAAMLAFGLSRGSAIFIGFAAIGVVTGLRMLRMRRRGPGDARWWMREHLGGMTGNAIATHIAFFSIGLPKLLPMLAGPILTQLAWFGPVVLAFAAQYWATRKYVGTAAARLPQAPALRASQS